MPPKVLIVDDDRYTRRVIETLIGRDAEIATYSPVVLLADDAASALAMYERERPEVVVTDLLSPPDAGFELVRALRERGGAELLAMSALWRDPEIAERLQRESGVAFFAKPFQVRDLVRAVREALAGPPEPVMAEAPLEAPPVAGLGAASGALAERPVPLLVFDMLENGATGTLSITRGRMRKELFLEGGKPIGIRSNLRRETLSAYLQAKHVLDSAQVEAVATFAHKGRMRFGQALVQLAYMNEAEVLGHLSAHVKLKLINCLRWRDGMWDFLPGPIAADVARTPIEAVTTVLRGLRKSARADAIAAEFEPHEALRLIPTPRVDDYGAPFRREFGWTAIDALSEQPRLGELLRTGNPIELLPALDALVGCGLAVLDPPPLVMPAPAPARARRRATPQADPLALANLRTGRTRDTGGGDRPSRNDIDEMFEDELAREDSDPRAHPLAAAAEEAGSPERAVLLRAYLALAGQTHYELLGVTQEASAQEITRAHDARAAELRRLESAPLEGDRPKLLELLIALRKAFEVLVDAGRRAAYDARLRPPAVTAGFKAETLFREGEDLLRRGDAAAAALHFQQVVHLRADQAEFHAMLGWALWLARGQPAAAEAEGHLAQALQIDPDLPAAHDFLGRMGLELGSVPADFRRAATHLGRALDLDPTRREAIDALERAHGAIDAFPDLERQYRKLIHDLEGRERGLSATLWKKLATLYADRLDDPKSALFAFDVAATLDPQDEALADRVVELASQVPDQWPAAVRALRAKWRLGGDLAPAYRLMQLHLDGGRLMAAARVAQAIRAFGGSSPLVQSTAGVLVSRGLSAPQPLDEAVWERVRASGDDLLLLQLLGLLAPVARAVRPIALEDLGILPQHRRTPSPAFAEAVARAGTLLGIQRSIDLYEHPGGGDEVRAVLGDPLVLAAGPRALASGDLPSLKFRVGRAVSYLAPPDRLLALAWPAKRTRALVLGALSAIGHRIEGLEGDRDAGRARSRVALEPDVVQQRLRAQAARVLARAAEQGVTDPQALDLAAWTVAVGRTADRVGLLCCDDLTAALRAQRSDPDGAAALLDWALGDDFLRARQAVYPEDAPLGTPVPLGQSPLEELFEPATDPGSGSGPLPAPT
jgi:CheY-like chemotaxis protein/tetratricopeptide (TPR) repeat protein